ncbi:restriction endonuclease [Micromonospora sp. SL4-19]|uniref:restriction endonuclease n=1 Tax=Micromonospora sp. SL4-19 TaxID=3399129 RepID=UPI003A4D6A2E
MISPSTVPEGGATGPKKDPRPNWPYVLATVLLVAPCAAVPSETIYPGPGWLNLLKLIGGIVLALAVGLTIVGIWGGPHTGDGKEPKSAVPSRDRPPLPAAVAAADEPVDEPEPVAAAPDGDRPQPREVVGPAERPVHEEEPMADFLRDDARTAWAYRRYLAQRAPGGINAEVGRRLLSSLEPGDHAELIADAILRKDIGVLDAVGLPRPATAPFVAVRTLRSWIFIDRSTGLATVFAGEAWGYMQATTSGGTIWPNTGWATVLQSADKRSYGVKLFLDDRDGPEPDIIENGAGKHILRLPEAPAVPVMPDLEALPAVVEPVPAVFLPADWQTAEEIACAHMRSLGFSDAETTTSGRDGGLDVVADRAVAQVKMLAQPVGAPPVQQLRGTRPHVAYHLFYSTSGYTPAAIAAAGEIGVALFRIGRNGSVTEVNEQAVALVHAGAVDDEDQVRAARGRSAKHLVEEYAQAVADRIMRAVKNTSLDKAHEMETYEGQAKRAGGYLKRALDNLEEQPSFGSLKSALIFYHHTELLAHVWFQELNVPYPGGAGDVEADSLESYYS